MKERAVEYISRKYASDQISSEEIKLCLYSICDNHSYLRISRDVVDKMIKFLTTFFSPDTYEEGYSLAISAYVKHLETNCFFLNRKILFCFFS